MKSWYALKNIGMLCITDNPFGFAQGHPEPVERVSSKYVVMKRPNFDGYPDASVGIVVL